MCAFSSFLISCSKRPREGTAVVGHRDGLRHSYWAALLGKELVWIKNPFLWNRISLSFGQEERVCLYWGQRKSLRMWCNWSSVTAERERGTNEQWCFRGQKMQVIRSYFSQNSPFWLFSMCLLILFVARTKTDISLRPKTRNKREEFWNVCHSLFLFLLSDILELTTSLCNLTFTYTFHSPLNNPLYSP